MFQRGLLDDAIAELDRMLTDDPGNVSGRSLRGQVLMNQGRFDEARHTLDRLLAIDPENATAYAMMARLELVRGAPDRALALAQIGSRQRGAFETLSVLQAEALIALGRRDDAVAGVDHVEGIEPGEDGTPDQNPGEDGQGKVNCLKQGVHSGLHFLVDRDVDIGDLTDKWMGPTQSESCLTAYRIEDSRHDGAWCARSGDRRGRPG